MLSRPPIYPEIYPEKTFLCLVARPWYMTYLSCSSPCFKLSHSLQNLRTREGLDVIASLPGYISVEGDPDQPMDKSGCDNMTLLRKEGPIKSVHTWDGPDP
jgi:hypothetical protein